jgi:hypothetical protein
MATTAKGHIEQLPSGSYRVKVYAGTDPVTGRERRLRETCPDEPSAAAALARLLKEAEGHQAPERDALFGRVLDVYLEVTELAVSTRPTHESYIRRIIRPVLGDVKARKIGPDTLDALNSHLKRCSRLCSRLGKTEHHTAGRTLATTAAGLCGTTAPPVPTRATTGASCISARRCIVVTAEGAVHRLRSPVAGQAVQVDRREPGRVRDHAQRGRS